MPSLTNHLPSKLLSSLSIATLLAVASFAPAAAAASSMMNADEFKLWKDYVAALEDPRVEKIPEKNRLAAIAKNFKVKQAVLQAAIDKGEKEGATAASDGEKAIHALIAASDLKGRVDSVRLDDSESHVVAYISWKNLEGAKLEQEAALLALLTAKGAPIASTVAIWALDAASGRKVFEAKISARSARKFQERRIPMFASARYIRQFENVRNAYKGTPPTESAPETSTN